MTDIENNPAADTPPEPETKSGQRLWPLIIGSIGVVYGDIGTSPLYAFREAAHHISREGMQETEIIGIVSLILWALFFVVTVKYIFFLLHADNKGEGGELSLMSLAYRKVKGRAAPVVLFAGLVGAALFFGDATITPAISVLSAVEGLKLASPMLGHYVLPISVLILFFLFSLQRTGTAKVSILFGPIMILWFGVLILMGVIWIARQPAILWAFSPTYAFVFLYYHSKIVGFGVLGAVFLAVTGAEALYTDLGHFGRKPISKAWIYLVFPALALNYLGQGALLLAVPDAIDNPFYYMAPAWALLPLIGLATIATIIASQAVITGAFSLTKQAILLGFLPRMEIRRTSAAHAGQIYIPKVNQSLLIIVLLLCLIFRDLGSLAAAYGIAVTCTMLVSSFLATIVIAKVWDKGYLKAVLFMAPFFLLEAVFFSANLVKFFDGGFLPILMGIVVVYLMTTWIKGTRYLYKKAQRMSVALIDLVEMVDREQPHIVPGTAIYLTSDWQTTPQPLLQNLRHNKVLHEKNIIVMVKTSHEPTIGQGQRVLIKEISSKIVLIALSFGYMETPDVPEALSQARWQGVEIDLKKASYFLGRRLIISDPRRGLPWWQDYIYIFLSKYATPATDFYSIPHNQVMEIGTRITI